jgi:intermediate peptidase
MIGHTEYQNVSGTHCAADLSNFNSLHPDGTLPRLPVCPRALWRAYRTHDRCADAMANHRHHHEDPYRNIDMYGQILLAVLDQTYHSRAAIDPSPNLTAAARGAAQ